jgi:hypothetical protein
MIVRAAAGAQLLGRVAREGAGMQIDLWRDGRGVNAPRGDTRIPVVARVVAR